MKKCKKCGILYSDTENFCIECGKRLILDREYEEEVAIDIKKALKPIRAKIMTEETKLETKIPTIEKRIALLEKNTSSISLSLQKFPTKLEFNSRINALENSRRSALEKAMVTIDVLEKTLASLKKGLGDGINRILENEMRIKYLELMGDANRNEMESLRSETKSEFDEMAMKITNINESYDEVRESNEMSIRKLNSRIDEINTILSRFKEIDLESVLRNFESLNQKSGWLESRLEEVNLDEVINRIEEMEAKINRLKNSSPLIIE